MTKHKHGHDHGHKHPPKKKAIHTDWRSWAVIVLMIGAVLGYVLSDNETLGGWWAGNGIQQEMPEDAAAE